MNRWQKLSDELSAENSAPTSNPSAEISPDAIRSQLSRLLASHRFQASPRCQSVLQYIVEEALAGNASTLKERTIGIAVFHKEAAYDTSSEPVVRVAVAETRKKLAQYYCEPDHLHELRIALPTGNYTPDFQWPSAESAPAARPAADDRLQPLSEDRAAVPTTQSVFQPLPAQARRSWRLWGTASALLLAICAIAAYRTWVVTHSATAVFWRPFTSPKSSALIVMGPLRASDVHLDTQVATSPGSSTSMPVAALSALRQHSMPVLSFEDASVMADLISYMHNAQGAANLKSASGISFRDLQKSPAILIGGLNNDWTLRFTHSLRFNFQQDEAGAEWWIADQQHPDKRWGDIHIDVRDPRLVDKDFALIARLMNSETGQPVLIIGGVTAGGTQAAVKFITSEKALTAFMQTAPKSWETKNCELLVSSQMIDGQAGPPVVEASTIW